MKVLFGLILILFLGMAGFLLRDWDFQEVGDLVTPLGRQTRRLVPTPTRVKDTSLEPYNFENLRRREFRGSQIVLERGMKEEEGFTSYLFSFQTDGKRVTGQANLPALDQNGSGPAGRQVFPEQKFPVVVMVRGHVEDEAYFTGAGTHKAVGVFAENGFITLAPDFLGFGGSDQASADILEARFEKPITILNLLASVKTLEQADSNKVFLFLMVLKVLNH